MQIELKELLGLVQGNESQSEPISVWEVGKNYHIRTVTMSLTGKLKIVGEKELVLADGAWIADTGRFADYLKNPLNASEVEPFVNDVIIGRGSVIDACIIETLPREQK